MTPFIKHESPQSSARGLSCNAGSVTPSVNIVVASNKQEEETARQADEGRYVASDPSTHTATRGATGSPRTLSPGIHTADPEEGGHWPRQVWSWDITCLRSTVTCHFFLLEK